jgi:hypothetical protein
MAQKIGIDPGQDVAGQHRGGHRGEGERRRQEGAGEPSVEIVGLAKRRGADDRAIAGLVVADHRPGHERGRGEHEDQSHDQVGLGDHERAVLVDEAAVADSDPVAGHEAEHEQEEHSARDPKERRAQLLAKFEGGDLGEHGRGLRQAARFG